MGIVHGTFHVILAAVLVVCFLAVLATLIAYLQPRLYRISRGQVSHSHRDCCPPGLGGNDPDKDSRHCLRKEARKLGRVAELTELERTWSEFCKIPRRQRKERAAAHSAYAAVRDGIIARVLKEATEAIDARRSGAVLPNHLPQTGSGRPVLNQANGNHAVAGHVVNDRPQDY